MSNGKTILVGGCFDVLHPGHIIFLKKAKEVGGRLIVLLESDRKIKVLKGINRPIHTQKERAFVLGALKCVDEVILLPFLKSDKDYDDIVLQIKPDIIAVTLGDPQIHFKKRAAELVGAKIKVVTKRIGRFSTSNLLKN